MLVGENLRHRKVGRVKRPQHPREQPRAPVDLCAQQVLRPRRDPRRNQALQHLKPEHRTSRLSTACRPTAQKEPRKLQHPVMGHQRGRSPPRHPCTNALSHRPVIGEVACGCIGVGQHKQKPGDERQQEYGGRPRSACPQPGAAASSTAPRTKAKAGSARRASEAACPFLTHTARLTAATTTKNAASSAASTRSKTTLCCARRNSRIMGCVIASAPQRYSNMQLQYSVAEGGCQTSAACGTTLKIQEHAAAGHGSRMCPSTVCLRPYTD